MLVQIGEVRWHVSTTVIASVAAGVVMILLILIICCCWCCCRKKHKKNKHRNQKVAAENSPNQSKGSQYGASPEQWQQQNISPGIAEHQRMPSYPPPVAAVSLPQFQHRLNCSPAHLPPNSSVSSTSGSSLPSQTTWRSPTPQMPSSSMSRSGGSVMSNTNGSSIPRQTPNPSFGSSQTMFSYEELAIATSGFSNGHILGQGGFGFVHKGVLPNGKEIAVKSLKADSGQGDREFQAEVETISRVHHRHLVSLVGYCTTGSERLLVYEFVPNKTLEFHLHGKEQTALDWTIRLKIAIGAAKGLAYLHEDCHPRIIHRDIKSANILLDESFEAKVADFGLAKFSAAADTHVSTRVMGTLGYLAPEYVSSGKLTQNSDVYSFGVMLLELISGRKPVDRNREEVNVVEWARPLLTAAIEDENYNYLVDPRIQYDYKHSEMSRMVYCAATCVRKSSKRRPKMSQVVRALEGNISLSDLSVGVAPGRSMVNRYGTSTDFSTSQCNGNSRGYGSSAEFSGSQYKGDSRGYQSTGMGAYYHDGTTSEYGLYASSSSSDHTTPELDTEEVNRESRLPQRRF